ncbi:splicing factor ESS-2 homolog [Branchiostoma floridae x Branchiostoma belcheri]
MALVKKDDKSMVVSTKDGGEGGKTKKPPKKVLDEDTYVKDLETIIQRDFFPDLTKLKAQQEYLQAVESNDHQKMRELAIKYGSSRLTSRQHTETPGAPGEYTPATFETPDVESSRGQDSPTSHHTAVNHSQEGEEPLGKKAKQDTDLPLDKYLAKNTSEDNASFGTIMEVTEDKNRQRHSWLYDAEKEHAEKQKEILQLKGPEQLAIEGSTSSVDTWSYKAKNALMYYPEGTESGEDVFKKPREILHKNTRLVRTPFDSDVAKSRLQQVAGANAQIKRGKIGHDGKEILPEDTPKVNGFGFVATPSPAPGVDESPMMTWGEIEGTPFRLDGSDTPAPSSTPGFKINEPRKREKLARGLVEKIGKSHRAKKEEALKRMTASFASPTPTFGSLKSMDRLNTMSPAAQRLINRASSRRSKTDKALRASYSPSPARLGAGNTPVRLTPRNTPLSVRRSPRHGKTPTVASASTSTDTSSLSDNLLNLPNTRPTRKKATDFF